MNEGIRRADTPYVILLNNDTEVLPEFVEELLAAIKNRTASFCGAMMIDYHDRGRIDNAGDYYTAFGWAVARGKGKPLADFNRPCRVFSCCGGAVIYRTGLLREMGPFDERHLHISRMSIWGIGQKSTDTSTAMRPERGCIMWGALPRGRAIMRKRCSSRRAIRCI